jgi:hypothetical protein
VVYLFALCFMINLHKFKLSAGNEISRDLEGITPEGRARGHSRGCYPVSPPGRKGPETLPGMLSCMAYDSDEGKKLSFSDN